MTAAGAFHWNELRTWDIGKARAFYGNVLGWTFDEMPDGEGYLLCMKGELPVAGLYPIPAGQGMDDIPESWFAFIAVDDLDVALGAVKASGGTVMREPFNVPGAGRIALALDANGAEIGFMEPEEGLSG